MTILLFCLQNGNKNWPEVKFQTPGSYMTKKCMIKILPTLYNKQQFKKKKIVLQIGKQL